MGVTEMGLGPALVGLTGGVVLGLAARRGRFCTLGAIEDAVYGEDWNRIRMWTLALAIAIGGTFLAGHVSILDLTQTRYAQTGWNPLASIIGGLTFGYGMAVAGNCGYGALARLGGGDLRSLVIVMVMGVVAYAVISGPLAWLRLALFPPLDTWHPEGFAHLLGDTLGVSPTLPALAIAAALAVWALSAPDFRRRPGYLLWGSAVGGVIVSAWIGTSLLATHSFDLVVVESHSFTAPVGETLLYMMTGSTGGPGFAIGSVVGVIGGATLGSLSQGHFRWEACDDPGELGRQILGGALMGVGGVIALGCSVGQGLTAFSTLAFSAPVVLASIVVGALFGLRQLIRGFEPT